MARMTIDPQPRPRPKGRSCRASSWASSRSELLQVAASRVTTLATTRHACRLRRKRPRSRNEQRIRRADRGKPLDGPGPVSQIEQVLRSVGSIARPSKRLKGKP